MMKWHDNVFFRYHIACGGPNVYMSVTLQILNQTYNTCSDSVRLQYPTGIYTWATITYSSRDNKSTSTNAGSQCTLCGSELECQERERQLDPLLLFNGQPGLLVDFTSWTNHIHNGCGFRLLATCVQRTFFEVSGCTVPLPPAPPSNPPPFPPDFGKRVCAYAFQIRKESFLSHVWC